MIGREVMASGYIDTHDRLAWAGYGLGLDSGATKNMVIRVDTSLIEATTLPSIKAASKRLPEAAYREMDARFREEPATKAILDRCSEARYAVFDDLILLPANGTLGKKKTSILPNVCRLVVKGSLIDRFFENEMKSEDEDKATAEQKVYVLGMITGHIRQDHMICVGQPSFLLCTPNFSMDSPLCTQIARIAHFVRTMAAQVESKVLIYHDFRAGSFCPPAKLTDTIYIFADPNAIIPSKQGRTGRRSLRQAISSTPAKPSTKFAGRKKYYTNWYFTLSSLMADLVKSDKTRSITFRHTDRLFPAKSTAPDGISFSDDIVVRLALAHYSPRDHNKFSIDLSKSHAEIESLYQAQVLAYIKKEGREGEYEDMLKKLRGMVQVCDTEDWGACPCCWKENL
jgi:hypothetical protein